MEPEVTGNEKIILEKLDFFIRKYYRNRIIKGLLLFFALIFGGFLLVIISEYLFRFGPAIRAVIFFFFCLLGGFLLVWFLIIPVLQLFKIGKILSHKQAARIIGEHFPGIQDKLLNTLQLIEQKRASEDHIGLLVASINQKIAEMKPYRFLQVIHFRKNIKYLKYILPPVIILIILMFLSPKMISEPVVRIVHFSEQFTEPLPYQIVMLNDKFEILQQEDFEVKIKVLGEEVPGEVFLRSGPNTFRMNKEKPRIYTYLFKNMQTNTKFYIAAGKATTPDYEILVYPRPIILEFSVTLTFPQYINKDQQITENVGDISAPEGTTATWNVYTKDVEIIEVLINNDKLSLSPGKNNVFSFSKRLLDNGRYSITPTNKFSGRSDSLNYKIEIIKDGYPTISVRETGDSSQSAVVFYEGIIKDDYGFSKLMFHYQILSQENTSTSVKKEILVPIEKSKSNQYFYYSTDLTSLLPGPGSGLSYYFEVWDNDAINGPKSTKSEVRVLKALTAEEVQKKTESNAADIQEGMENSLRESQTVSKNMDELKRKLVDQNNLSWVEKQKIELQIKNLEKISQDLEKIKKKTDENIKNEENILKTNERIIEKQKKLGEMMDHLLNEEIKKMIRDLKEMLKEADKEKMEEMLGKIKLNNKEIEEQLDRNLELFKRIEFERKLSEQVSELRKLADKQEKLAETTENRSEMQEKLLNAQDSIKNKFDSIASRLNELDKSAKEAQSDVNLEKTKPEQQEIQNDLNENKNNLQKKYSKKSVDGQRNTAKKMRNLANTLESMQQEAESDQLEEDANNIRNILENLIRLSFRQEYLLNQVKSTSRNDPKFLQLINEQVEIGERLKVSEDSLNAIAKRQVQVRPVIMKELGKVRENIQNAVSLLNNRALPEAISREQFVMTSINNLALLLSEALDQMNQEMNSMSGKEQSSCKRPSSKGGKASMKGMKQTQEQLGKELEKMKKSLEKMKSEGNGGKQEQGQMNKELAKMAAQQEAIRNELQKYKESLMESGDKQGLKDSENLSKTMDEMENLEKEILNKMISQETINRQQRILTRMLESEKAEQQRDKEEMRESVEAKSQKVSNPMSDFQYKMKKKQEAEILKLTPLPVNHFYKEKIETYTLTIDKQ